MQKEYILVLDSGIGGLSILKELKKNLPNENYLYLADNFHSPYGNKKREFGDRMRCDEHPAGEYIP